MGEINKVVTDYSSFLEFASRYNFVKEPHTAPGMCPDYMMYFSNDYYRISICHYGEVSIFDKRSGKHIINKQQAPEGINAYEFAYDQFSAHLVAVKYADPSVKIHVIEYLTKVEGSLPEGKWIAIESYFGEDFPYIPWSDANWELDEYIASQGLDSDITFSELLIMYLKAGKIYIVEDSKISYDEIDLHETLESYIDHACCNDELEESVADGLMHKIEEIFKSDKKDQYKSKVDEIVKNINELLFKENSCITGWLDFECMPKFDYDRLTSEDAI